MKKTGYHHGDLRSALLTAARTLVAEHGPDGFTMARAAREAGVSSGAPYKHFADRAALMNALAEQGRQALMDRVHKASARATDPLESFRQVGIAYAQFAVDEPGWFRVMAMPEYLGTIDDDPDIVGFWTPLADLVNSLPPDAELPADHPLIASFAARVLVHGLASMLVAGTLGPLGIQRDRAAQLADVITRATTFPALKAP